MINRKNDYPKLFNKRFNNDNQSENDKLNQTIKTRNIPTPKEGEYL
ncbi:MAG: hypothetical protein ACFFAU_18150 [Candidatus Hodarchaeota archaeon]